MNKATQLILRNNLAWLLASFLLAVVVWVTAAIQADPILQQTFPNVAVQIDIPDGLVVTNAPRLTSRVLVRAQRSVLSLLTIDDIIVTAELEGRTDGTHIIPLSVAVNRSGVLSADTQPTQITISLDTIRTEQKAVRLLITQVPPVDYTYDPAVSSVLQVAISGALNRVNEVIEVHGEIDLSASRGNFNGEVTLIALDADGRRVTDVTLEPRSITVDIRVYPRDDVRQLSVRPSLLLETLTEDYVLSSISYEPQTVFVSGTNNDLLAVGATLDTAAISLEGRTNSFTVEVPLLLPANLLVLGDTTSIRVTIGVTAQTTVRQLDNIPIEIIGLPADSTASLTPNTLSVVLNGPIAILDGLTISDIQAVVDLNNVRVGTRDVTPRVIIQRGEVTLDSITIIPSTVAVTLSPITSEATQAP